MYHRIWVTRLIEGESTVQDIVTVTPTFTVWEVGGISIPIAGEREGEG